MIDIYNVYLFARRIHKGQIYGKKPFIKHPMQVATLIKYLCPLDYNLQAAAVLHDVMECGGVSYLRLEKEFGKDIAQLVREVTKSQYNTFPYLKTQRGVILKFADRLSNLSNLNDWPKKEIKRYILKSKFWR